MAENIQIRAGGGQYIQGLHAFPKERSYSNIDKLLVVMLHDFPGNKDGYEGLSRDLSVQIADKGYHTFRFDYRGCGESDGREEDFTLAGGSHDLQHVIRWAKSKGYERFILISEGLGAPVALQAVPDQTLCMIMMWPMIDLPLIAKQAFNADNIEQEWKKAGYMLINEHRVGMPFMKELKMTTLSGELKRLKKPLLIMHGSKDETSPISQLDLVRQHTNARRVEITSFHDGTYGLPQENHRKTMAYHIMQFIEKYT